LNTRYDYTGLALAFTQHSESNRRLLLSPQHFLLASLLAFCSEIVLWTNPPTRGVLDWLLLALGYLALSALLLEIAERYRVRNAYGLLLLAGIYGLLNGLILNPHSALIDTPRTLITRSMGAHALAGLFALVLFFALSSGLRSRRGLLIALGVVLFVGVGWGTWARWSPPVFESLPESAPETLLIYAGAGAVLIALALAAVRRSTSPTSLRLNPRGWAFTLLVLFGLTVFHLLRGEVDGLSLSIIITLSAFSVMILWFHKRKKGSTLLDGLANATPNWLSFVILLVAFAIGGTVGYGVPRGEGNSDPLALLGALFTAYGLIWLPAISLVLGARAFSRQTRGMNL
jgi:hypothetical protein